MYLDVGRVSRMATCVPGLQELNGFELRADAVPALAPLTALTRLRGIVDCTDVAGVGMAATNFAALKHLCVLELFLDSPRGATARSCTMQGLAAALLPLTNLTQLTRFKLVLGPQIWASELLAAFHWEFDNEVSEACG